MDRSMIEAVRRFNRAVTQRIGALDDAFGARGRPPGQARLLAASAVQIGVRDPRHPDARYCLRAYVEELSGRFDGGFDPARSISAADHEMIPPAGLFLVATLHAEPVGCGALKFHPGAPAEIKRMWVAPSARGLAVPVERVLLALVAYPFAA
jgi:GNAT superfamily N-acetyltransferase